MEGLPEDAVSPVGPGLFLAVPCLTQLVTFTVIFPSNASMGLLFTSSRAHLLRVCHTPAPL